MSDCQRPLKSCVTRLISLYIEESRIMRKLRTYACRLRVADRADERDMIRMFGGRGVTVYWIGGPIGSSPSPTPTGAGLRSPAGLGTNTPGRACCYPGPGHTNPAVYMSKSVDGSRPVPLPKSVDGAATPPRSQARRLFFLPPCLRRPPNVAGARMPTLHVVQDSAQGAYDVDSRMHAAPEPVRFFCQARVRRRASAFR